MNVQLTDKVYNVLKWISIIAVPALVVLILTIGSIWGLPNAEKIAETVAAIGVFLGALIGVSCAQYNKNKEA